MSRRLQLSWIVSTTTKMYAMTKRQENINNPRFELKSITIVVLINASHQSNLNSRNTQSPCVQSCIAYFVIGLKIAFCVALLFAQEKINFLHDVRSFHSNPNPVHKIDVEFLTQPWIVRLFMKFAEVKTVLNGCVYRFISFSSIALTLQQLEKFSYIQ